MIRTVIADRQVLVREGFKSIADKEIDITVIQECKNTDEVMTFVEQHDCDVLVLDIELPNKNWIDLLAALGSIAPGIKVIVYSPYIEEHFALRAIQAGASGYITRDKEVEELIFAIRKVHQGGIYLAQKVAEYFTFKQYRGDIDPHERLSNREFQVLQLIGSGKSVGEISGTLSLSSNTVNTYRKRIFEKLGMSTSSELIHYAMRNSLVI
jgi:DNA-binding NarL/FixJ family response regulator